MDKNALRRRCERGLVSRFGAHTLGSHRERLAYELSVIGKLGYSDQFLKLAKIASYIRKRGIRMGPGRGAAPASLVCWTLGITHLDPVYYDLLFERFLNLGTRPFPVVEMDVSPAGREQILAYLRRTWGADCVARMGCIARRPPGPEGKEVGRGVHASAICLSERPLKDQIPLRRDETGGLVTEDEEEVLQAKGLFVFGLVPLRDLDRLPRSFSVRDYEGLPLNLKERGVFKRLSRGSTRGGFQLDSPGIQALVKRVKPESLEHIAALIALYRPGPLDSGLTDLYIKRRHQKRPIRYYNLTLMDILEETYGLILYQEQIMAIAKRIAGFSPEMVDGLRKAIGRKHPAQLRDWRRKFIAGCRRNGTSAEHGENAISKEFSVKLFGMLEKFGGYAFMRSHAVTCALLAGRSAAR